LPPWSRCNIHSMNMEQYKKEEGAANDNFDTDAERQSLAEEQRAIYSLLSQTVSSQVWEKLGTINHAQTYNEFSEVVDELNRLMQEEGQQADERSIQLTGVINTLKGWKLKVSRDTEGRYVYETIA